MSISESKKASPHIIVEIIGYALSAIVSKSIIKKTTANISVSSFAAGEELPEKTFPYDTCTQIIDSVAEVAINDTTFKLKLGGGITIPANAPHCFNANEQFKMISTSIKSAED